MEVLIVVSKTVWDNLELQVTCWHIYKTWIIIVNISSELSLIVVFYNTVLDSAFSSCVLYFTS